MPGSVPQNSRSAPAPPSYDRKIAFRVRVGVTGHRQIADETVVARAVADRLEQIRGSLGPTRATPVVFTILSALAEGADRIVARVALDASPEIDGELGAVLPLTLADYLDDFESDASRGEFRELLARSAAHIALLHKPTPVGRERDAAYAQAGRYIVDHSDVLIAIWDGREAQGHGGTADVVAYAKQQCVPVVLVSVADGHDTDGHAHDKFDGSRMSEIGRRLKNSFQRIDRFNRVSLTSRRESEKIIRERLRLGRPLENTPMYRPYLLVADWALPSLARADKLASANHTYHTALAWLIHMLAALAVAVVAVQTLFFPDEPRVLVGEIALVLMLLLAVATGRYTRFNDRWIGYRSLAEAFRSTLFLSLSGGNDRERLTTIGVFGEPDEPWFQRAFSQAWRSCPHVEPEPDDVASLRQFLVAAWIERQIEYHRNAARRWRKLQNLCTRTIGVLAITTILVALLHIAGLGRGTWLEDLLKLLALTLPAFGGAAAGLREFGQLRFHEERSDRTAIRLQGLKNRATSRATLASVRKFAVDVQRMMVDETLDWHDVVEHQDVDIFI
jgi:hypothetical protein